MSRAAMKIIVLTLSVVGLLWMDLCLYYHIQAIESYHNDCNPPDGHSHNSESSTAKHEHKHYIQQPKTIDFVSRNKQKKKPASGSSWSSLRPINATIEEGTSSTTRTPDVRQSWLPASIKRFSFAFRGISVKLMMTDPVDNYLLGPLAEAFGEICNFRDNFKLISANMVSVAGTLSAVVASIFVSRPNSNLLDKLLAFAFFQLRNWLDNLDGIVARSRMGITRHMSLEHTSGYIVDGVCDAIGFLVFIWGIYLSLRRSRYNSYQHVKKSEDDNRTETRSDDRSSRLLLLIGLFLIQLALSAAAWNWYILRYDHLLESPPSGSNQFLPELQLRILKSNIMFVIIYLWRYTNGHSLMQFLSISMLVDKTWQFLELIKFVGFIEIVILVVVTQLHTMDTSNYLSIAETCTN